MNTLFLHNYKFPILVQIVDTLCEIISNIVNNSQELIDDYNGII